MNILVEGKTGAGKSTICNALHNGNGNDLDFSFETSNALEIIQKYAKSMKQK